MRNTQRAKADVPQGTLDLMCCRRSRRSARSTGTRSPRLEQVSAGALRVNMGTLYPGLMRLEQRGLIRADWGLTDNNRRARFYGITAAGRRQLAAETTEWDRMVSIMRALLTEQS
jgi:PadR family transcriptional regulator PadR